MPQESKTEQTQISNAFVHSESEYWLIQFDVVGLKSMESLLTAYRPAQPHANHCMPWRTKVG